MIGIHLCAPVNMNTNEQHGTWTVPVRRIHASFKEGTHKGKEGHYYLY
jgi:hypothetical protein